MNRMTYILLRGPEWPMLPVERIVLGSPVPTIKSKFQRRSPHMELQIEFARV
jgi:hypothetical protein